MMWPFRRKPLLTEPDKLTLLHRELAELRQDIAQALRKPSSPPFVCVLVEAMGPHGPTTCGGVGKPQGDRIEVELQTQQPLTDVRVTVFADLSRVSIHGIFCGVDLMTVALGSCPVDFFKEWNPGTWLRVQALEIRP